MQIDGSVNTGNLPLAGCRVIERSRSVAAAYAGRLLAVMGAEVTMLEPPGGSPLRQTAPLLPDGESALFAYLSVGKRSQVCDPSTEAGRKELASALEQADIFIDDTPVKDRSSFGVDPASLGDRHPNLVHLSVLPFGSVGPKAHWEGEEVNLIHAGGEGFLLPNGLTHELFPDRPPLKIYGYFGSFQGGAMAALGAMAAWWAVPASGGQYVDIAVQDAVLAVGCFALQRLGDGSLEHRSTRSFRYGGVFETRTGYIELLTLEDRQWASLVELLGQPDWSQDPALKDPLERSRRGAEINQHIREWMAQNEADDVVQRAQKLGVPVGKYRQPEEVINGEQERARKLFAPATLCNGATAQMLVAPFQFHVTPLQGGGKVPAIGEHGGILS